MIGHKHDWKAQLFDGGKVSDHKLRTAASAAQEEGLQEVLRLAMHRGGVHRGRDFCHDRLRSHLLNLKLRSALSVLYWLHVAACASRLCVLHMYTIYFSSI